MKSLIFALFIHVALGKVDFCEDHQLPESKKSSRLQFTKETSTWEYAVDSKFKSLHCCAKGYLSIEWFKDGKAYPWPGDVSTYIIYPESENQTIYTKSLKASDAGNYSCRITRENDHLIHNTELIVFDSTEYMEKPLSTYKPPEVSTATFGQETRLFCEAFVGHIDLPDAASEVSWLKNGKELVLENNRISIERVQRENGQIVGAYLNIKAVLGSDLGTYTCTISNTGDQKIIMETELKAYTGEFEPLCFQNHKTLITFIFLFPFASFLVFYFYMFFIKREAKWSRVWVKVSEMTPFNKKNQHKSGLVIIYSENDQTFMEETFFPQLREQANLYIFPQKINYDVPELTEETKELCTKVQKTVIILSRNLTNEWSRESINLTLERLILKESLYQIVLLETLPETSDSAPFFRHLQSKLNLMSWEEAIDSGILTFLKSRQVVQRLEHRNSHSIVDFFKKNKNSSEVHV